MCFGERLEGLRCVSVYRKLGSFPTEAEAQWHFKKLLRQSLRKAKRAARGSAARTVDKFQVPLRKAGTSIGGKFSQRIVSLAARCW